MRAFIGISLPESVRDSLASLQQELARSQADVKWVEPRNLHVTLKFLDEISDKERAAVEAMLREIASSYTPFTLCLERLGAFPSLTAPRVVWVGLGAGREIAQTVTEQIEERSRALSLRKEERPFAGHLTLGRVRSPKRREALTQQLRTIRWQVPAPWQVSAIMLYQSTLSSAGPRYNVLTEVPLRVVGDK